MNLINSIAKFRAFMSRMWSAMKALAGPREPPPR